ncbi:MAG: VOC family protein [Bacteroidota bacterium]
MSTPETWSAAQHEVWQTVASYSDASKERDLERYLSHWHPRFLGWHSGDDVPTNKADRAEGLNWYFSQTTPEDYALEPLGLEVVGTTAVVHYRIQQTLRMPDGSTAPDVSHWTDVLVKEDGRWWLMSDHGGSVAPASVPAESLGLKVNHVRLRVHDVDAAAAFYTDVLGFERDTAPCGPGRIGLKGAMLPLVLEEADGPLPPLSEATPRTKVTLEAYDLHATMARLKGEGVAFTIDPPVPFGVNAAGEPLGLATRFQDPMGHEFSIVEEPQEGAAPFDGIRVYNAGFDVPDVEAAQTFYTDALGFEVLSDEYLPNVPMQHTDGSFAFMLHGHTDLGPAPTIQPDEAAVMMVFSTADLAQTVSALQQRGVDVLINDAVSSVVTFQDPFGNVVQVSEVK